MFGDAAAATLSFIGCGTIAVSSLPLTAEGNGAEEFGYRSTTGLVAAVGFDDDSSREMQADPRVSFSVSDGCGSVDASGQLSVNAGCRAASIRINATAVLGDSVVEHSLVLSVVWLEQLEVKLFYAQAYRCFSCGEVYSTSSPCA